MNFYIKLTANYVLLLIILVISTFFGFAQQNISSSQTPQNTQAQDSALDQEIDIFADFESIDNELEINSIEQLQATDTIQINKIIVTLNGTTYTDPNKNTALTKAIPTFNILFSEISVRQNDVYTVAKLDKNIKLWTLYLEDSYYYSNPSITYSVLDNTEGQTLAEQNSVDESPKSVYKVNVYISVLVAHSFIYFAGNTYVSLGYKIPNGTLVTGTVGANKNSFEYENNNVLLQKSESKQYVKMPMVYRGKVFWYWDWPQSTSDTMFYGTDFYFGFKPFSSTTLSLGSAINASNTLSNNSVIGDTERKIVNLPLKGFNTISFDGRFVTNYHLPLYESYGYYKSYIDFELPLAVGMWNDGIDAEYKFFDTYSLAANLSLGFYLWKNQNLTVTLVATSNGAFDYLPYFAKANLGSNIYDSYLFRFRGVERIGSGFDIETLVANKGYSASMKYGLMIIESEKFKLLNVELFLRYDVGAVANEFQDLMQNTRHTLAPGVAVYVGAPVGLNFNFSLPISGSALGQTDGSPLGFSFWVNFN